MPPRYVVIANPGTKRCATYRTELKAYWSDRGTSVELEIVPWAEIVSRNGNLDDLPAFNAPALVRLESPGKDDTVTRLLLEAGARDGNAEPTRDWLTLELPKGLLVQPGLLHRGFVRVLRGLRRSFDSRPHLTPTACPLAVAAMFDKIATCRKIEAAGVPVPGWFEGPALGETLLDRIRIHERWPTAYVKLNTGSSATGIVVLRMSEEEEFTGTTTLAEIDSRFYNSRLIQTKSGASLMRALTFILSEGAIVQYGIPMARIDGQNFDVRVVCVYGNPVATIFRLSHQPMTNLHLGGRRGDHERCRAAIPKRDWLDALDQCSNAAMCFDSAIAGVDLLFERGFRRHYVLEVNAFGDFFPGWIDAHGRSVHQLEIDATARRFA